MANKLIKHGNHIANNETDGYMYNLNISEGYTFNSHIHKCFEFIHIIKGRLVYTVENSEYILTDGDFVMTKPQEFHSFSFPENCEYHREFLHIYPGFLKKFPELIDNLEARNSGYFNRIPVDIVRKYGVDTIFKTIEEYCKNPIPETDLMVLSSTIALALKISQILRDEVPEPQKIVSNKKADLACRYINEHFCEDLTLNSVASAVYMSPSYLSGMFKKEMGMTLKTYLTMRRIMRAKSLIMQGYKITSVFTECGFNDYSTLYRAFVKLVGMKPDEFKRMQLGLKDKE